jgi:hypothetical protein
MAMKIRSLISKKSALCALIVVNLALSSPLAAQEEQVDWQKARKHAEAYFGEPTVKNAAQLIRSLPESPVPKENRGPWFYEFLNVFSAPNLAALREQMFYGAHPYSAVSIAFACYTVSEGWLDHRLDQLLGDFIRVDPGKFLTEFQYHPQGHELTLKYGYMLCDGRQFDESTPDAVLWDLGERIKTLETVDDDELIPIRDECIKTIHAEITRRLEFSRSHSEKKLSKDVMDEFLLSPFLDARRRAYDHIIANKERFLPALREILASWRERMRTIRYLNKLVYLAAIFRHGSLIPSLEEMIEEPAFAFNCLYNCPLTFTMSIYGYFTAWKPPAGEFVMGEQPDIAWIIHDIRGDIQRIGKADYKKGDPRNSIKGPGVDDLFDRMVKLNEKELIKIAGPENMDGWERTVAAYTLEYTVDNSSNLDDLYWLAINEIVDASAQYRSAIYWAIYRAERARQDGK